MKLLLYTVFTGVIFFSNQACADDVRVRKAEAIRIAEVSFFSKFGALKKPSSARLATMKNGRIVLVHPDPDVAFSTIKDADSSRLRQWQSELEGQKFWLVTVRGRNFSTTIFIDSSTGADRSFRPTVSEPTSDARGLTHGVWSHGV